MKNYIIVAIIIILIIVGVVWFKTKTPATIVPDEIMVTTEPALVDETVPVVIDQTVPVVDETIPAVQ